MEIILGNNKSCSKRTEKNLSSKIKGKLNKARRTTLKRDCQIIIKTKDPGSIPVNNSNTAKRVSRQAIAFNLEAKNNKIIASAINF